MLDKSIPYKHIIMRRPAGTPIPPAILPAGYRFVFYQPGDERHWAAIETSVLEFPAEIDAFIYYQQEWLPYARELPRRCLFIEDAEGEKVATGTAFWYYSGTRRDPWVDWISVRPECQGIGLGKAIFARVVRLMVEIEGDRDFYLHTQTWSHKAVRIYEKAGFSMTPEQGLGICPNEYEEALAILESLGSV